MSKKTLVNESVIRRWGKLANMPALTENFLDTVETIEEEDMEMNPALSCLAFLFCLGFVRVY